MRDLLVLGLVLALSVVSWAGCSQRNGAADPTEGRRGVPLSEESFRTLLTVEDVEGVLLGDDSLQPELRDLRKMAEAADPTQVAAMDSWYGLIFGSEGGSKAMTFTVIDFDSPSSAQKHFQKVKSETGPPLLQDLELPIGDVAAATQVNSKGIGSVVVFVEADKAISLHTTKPEGQQPLTDLPGLKQLADIVDRRLR